MMSRIASFHLVREQPGHALHALIRLGTDRRSMAMVPGLRFWRLLGTGRGTNTALSIDPRRTALFAVWDDETSLDRFMAGHRVVRRWEGADEAWHVRLRGVGGHGTWRGYDVLEGLIAGRTDGPVAVLTRADVRMESWRAFGAVSRVVNAEVARADGMLAVAGIGEAPVGRLGTFSLWESAAAAREFGARTDHSAATNRARSERWFSEELFAWFEPVASSGSWNGCDPLRAPPTPSR